MLKKLLNARRKYKNFNIKNFYNLSLFLKKHNFLMRIHLEEF
jgi:hypothetical protein